jgi:hypothetical protein
MLRGVLAAALAVLLIGGQCVNCAPQAAKCCCKGHCKCPGKKICSAPDRDTAAVIKDAAPAVEFEPAPAEVVHQPTPPLERVTPATPAEGPRDLPLLHSSLLI